MTITTKTAPNTTAARTRGVRIIQGDSFRVADRGTEWAYTFHATWWHQVRGVRGFHERLMFGMAPKSQYPAPPTVEDVAANCNGTSGHTWQVSE